MATRKKTAAPKKTTAKKAPAKKAPAKKAPAKKAAATKVQAKKATAKKTVAKKAPEKKQAASKAAVAAKVKPTPAERPTSPAPEKPAAKGGVSATQVNLGHILALRQPRVSPSFPQSEFLKAKRELADEGYASIEEAARAVAEKALSGTNQKPKGRSGGRR